MRCRFSLVLILSLLCLAACGGGGGGGGSDAAPAPEPSPSAVNDQVSVDEESSVTIDVTANDSLVDESSVVLGSSPANGTVELSGHEFVYTPAADYSGSDSFGYSVTGNNGASLSATVSITVIDINDAPVAMADSFTIIEDSPLQLSLDDNDTDIDGVISDYEISGSFPGQIAGTGVNLVYTPPLDFTGDVSFEYQAIDDDGELSNTVTVNITVAPVTVTVMEVVDLPIPASGYAVTNDPELGGNVLSSSMRELIVPPNVISVLFTLSGADANIEEGGLFISNLVPPSGPFVAYQKFVHFCFGGNCSGLVPRSPAFVAESGVWTYQLGTMAGSLDSIDFSSLSLKAVVRTGPTPDTGSERPAVLHIKPFLTADSVGVSDIENILVKLFDISAANQIELEIDPVTIVAEGRFDRVSASFLDANTAELTRQGGPTSVNLFFLEGFTDDENLAAISGGIPGSLGTNDGHNGVLIDAVANLGISDDFYIKRTAETAFHEMGHLLGLYHTTEARFSSMDVIDDTPFCDPDVDDSNEDGVAGSGECPDASNPMFWQNSFVVERGLLTGGQKHVIFYSPIAVPGGL